MKKKNKDIKQEKNELIDAFISESHEFLDDAESKFQSLDKEYSDDIVNTIFRMFHSIKGSAGFLNFESIKAVTHEAETLLTIYRDNRIKPSQEEIDLLYQTTDFIRQLIINIENGLDDEKIDKEAQIIIHNITECIENLKAEKEKLEAKDQKGGKKKKAFDDDIITPEILERFQIESLEHLDQSEKEILLLEKDLENMGLVKSVMGYIHSIKGNSGFFGFDLVESECIELESFLDDLIKQNKKINKNIITFLLDQIDAVKLKVTDAIDSKLKRKKESRDEVSYKKLGEILIEEGKVTEDDVNDAITKQHKAIGEILLDDGKIDKKSLDKALQAQKEMIANLGLRAENIIRKDIRVSTDKLDKLFDLVGEIITSQAMVLHHPDLNTFISESYVQARNYLEKMTRELQEVSMNIRMIPLEGLFNKMFRLVRDLAKKSGKQVELQIHGAETEMDKNVIEMISDPLVHLIRNAIDHGLESAKERSKKGKNEKGILVLTAQYVGNEIWVSIKDDGKGLDREKIYKKALEKNIIKDKAIQLTDHEVYKLIFEPGFSTAEVVTNISGRGVGMDVVKKNIEKIRGKVDIDSDPGKGTEIIMKIPLTMAIIDAIIARVGQNLYSIPTLEIVEFFRALPKQINVTEHQNVVINLRGEIIPTLKLAEYFKIESKVTQFEDGIIIVIQKHGKKLCLLIDEILSSQQIVIKSLSSYMGEIRGVSGCSIMSNGEVALIIDTGSVINEILE